MTKTSKRKLIVSAATLLGGVGTVGATFGAIVLTGGTTRQNINDGINVGTVTIQNQVVDLKAEVNDGTLVVDGWQTEADKTGSPANATDVQNDLQFSIDVTVTGDPSVWSSVSITLDWDSGHPNAKKYLTLPTIGDIEVASFSGETASSASETEKTFTISGTLTWTAPYTNGIINYINTEVDATRMDVSQAATELNSFKSAVDGAKVTATLQVNLNN